MNIKKLLFTTILAYTAFVAHYSNGAATPKILYITTDDNNILEVYIVEKTTTIGLRY